MLKRSARFFQKVAKGHKAAVSEVIRTAEIINYAAEEGLRMEGEVLEGGSFEAASKKKIAIVRREPVGLVLAISPFNYPVNLAGSKLLQPLLQEMLLLLNHQHKALFLVCY